MDFGTLLLIVVVAVVLAFVWRVIARSSNSTGGALIGGYVAIGVLAVLAGLSLHKGKALEGPLLEAVTRGDALQVNRLLTQGAPANAAQADGERALCLALDSGNEEIVTRLLESGADAVSPCKGGTPVKVAAAKNMFEAVSHLKEHGGRL